MLVELSIKNLAVIESAQVRFERGFHVLTGETGAGKSMIIDALSLIAGGRASSDFIRHGADRTEIIAAFELEPAHPVWQALKLLGIDFEENDQLIINRDVSSSGKSSARINGQPVNISMLRSIGSYLINIHGQHEHQSLLHAEQHIEWLDRYGEKQIAKPKQAYRICFEAYAKIKSQLKELKKTSQENLQMIDLYRFQADELEKANLKVGEDEWLEQEKHKLANAEKLFQAVSSGYNHIYEGEAGLEKIGEAMSQIEVAATFDVEAIEPVLEQIKSAYFQLEDAAHELRQYRDGIEFNLEKLHEIESRLDLLFTLKRKYGRSVEEITAYHEEIQTKLQQLENKDELVDKLQKELTEQEQEMKTLADELTKVRTQVAQQLAKDIERELADLHMAKTLFEARLESKSDYDGKGQDQVEFLIAPNPGEPLKSLQKIASGGELSRIMLALKSIFAKMDRIPVLVFDEVDTGVSGRAAQAIADKLSGLSVYGQVFAITHLPQVACMADAHYEIKKVAQHNQTYTLVDHLNLRQRTQELARMLGGVEVTATTEQHAKEMLDMAEQKKEKRKHLQL